MDEVAEAIEKYKGLVPLVYDIETMGLVEARPQDMYYAVYLKREADKEFAKLKRELWLARAELCRRLDVDRYLRKHINSWYNENLLTFNDACVAMEVKMCDAESKCLAKAELYK